MALVIECSDVRGSIGCAFSIQSSEAHLLAGLKHFGQGYQDVEMGHQSRWFLERRECCESRENVDCVTKFYLKIGVRPRLP
jgi:hypothetical protein